MALVSYGAYPNIMIDDPGAGFSFGDTVREALAKIASEPKGLQLLQEIQANAPTFAPWGGSVKIYRAALLIEQGGSKAAAVQEEAAKSGIGSASGVAWNSNVFAIPGQGPRPPFVGLAHELIHAWHNAKGTKKASYEDEENFTVGLGAYMLPTPGAITENMIRLEHGVPIRHRY
ncbi:MAG TPA: M91 family zinc metallopeptidase [Caulobacteraceae bacterium]|jgi:hypothetical protein|nr:M91 family zinc metallopeptidase [Caulobacteraceae bacterium]